MVLLGSELLAEYRDKCEKRIFQQEISVDRSMNVLDIGCGTGRWELFVSNRCRQIVGFDFSQALLNVAAQKMEEIGANNVTLICSTLGDFDTDEKYDLAIISSVLLYVPDSEVAKLLQKLNTIMIPEGKVFNLEFTGIRESFRGGHGTDSEYSEYQMRTTEQFVKLFYKAGFELDKEGYAMPPFIFTSLLCRLLVPNRFRETRLMKTMLRIGLRLQYSIIDPVLNRIPRIYKMLLFFKRAYPVHHRYYIYTKRHIEP